MALENCPNCGNDLAAPLSSGRQVCMNCGWSDRPKKTTQPSYSSQRVESTSSSDTRKALSALCHGSVFLSSILVFPIAIPIVLYFTSNDSVVRANAAEAIKFQIYCFLAGIVLGLVALLMPFLVLLLFPVAIVLILACLILPILAIVHCFTSDEPYVYPFI